MKGAGQKNIIKNTPRWESELWSNMSRGDGIHCPIYQSCPSRQHSIECLSEHDNIFDEMNRFIDNDLPSSLDPAGIVFPFPKPTCIIRGRIFQLVRRLANRYAELAGLNHPPVPSDLFSQIYDRLPIEVRRIPLKAYRGAVWRLSDCWVVHLNSNDTPARQRFTLYHEIFHILAHSKATPVFKKSPYNQEGTFNEMLADHFAAVILLPTRLVQKEWPGLKDIRRTAALFEAPEPVVWATLRLLRMI